MPRVYTASINEDDDFTPIARVKNGAGTLITQASLTSITYYAYDTGTATQTGTGTLTISSVVFDTLQTGSNWTVDGTGYNFLATIPGTCFPDGGKVYRVEIVFNPVSGSDFTLSYDVTTVALYSR